MRKKRLNLGNQSSNPAFQINICCKWERGRTEVKVWNFGGNGKRGLERSEITGIATADDEDRRGGGGYIVADERAESRVALVPVEQRLSFLNVAGVPVVGVTVIVRLAARHVPHRHVLLTLNWIQTHRWLGTVVVGEYSTEGLRYTTEKDLSWESKRASDWAWA